MTTSGDASLLRTRLPWCTSSAPVRPDTDAAIFVYCSCNLAFSTAAASAATAAFNAAADVTDAS